MNVTLEKKKTIDRVCESIGIKFMDSDLVILCYLPIPPTVDVKKHKGTNDPSGFSPPPADPLDIQPQRLAIAHP